MEDCIFCKIAGGEIPSATIYEDDDFRVILDLGPATFGHALILPKAHYKDLTEIPDELLAKAAGLAKKVVITLKKELPCDGYNVIQNNGIAAGQSVFHFHIHLIPRYQNDHAHILWTPGKLSDEDRDEILRKTAGKL
jgi:histidine triad (HIT) family protein